MPHDTPLLSTLAIGLVLAFAFGTLATRLKLPPIAGYLLAGVAAGPFTPGFVADPELSKELSEIGVILLMFGVGLHFSIKDLLAVRRIAVPGAVVQIAVATLMGMGVSHFLGWSLGSGLIFGLSLSVASTVVLLRALEERQMVESRRGRIAVGWLIVEDLLMVLALVVLPALAGPLGGEAEAQGDSSLALELGLTALKVGAFIALMLVVGRRAIPWLLARVVRTGSRELFTLATLAIAMGIAYGSAALFGVSFALGAFFAGVVLNESELSHDAAENSLPLREAFAVLFFFSVGSLFDPAILLEQPLAVLATVAVIVFGKSIAAALIVLAYRRPLSVALTIAASLAQIGEFSFILASLGLSLKLLDQGAHDLILAAAIISIILNPLLFHGIDLLQPWMERREGRRLVNVKGKHAPELDDDEPDTVAQRGHLVLVGYGRVGRYICERLDDTGSPLIVIADEPEHVTALRQKGFKAILGNATQEKVLARAKLQEARALLLAIPTGFEAAEIARRARELAPGLHILARAHHDDEIRHLENNGVDEVIMGEREIAHGMFRYLGLEQPGEHEAEPRRTPQPSGAGS
ncbi:YbaL family putative K(+) efflux transporter [Pseudomonas oryzihabitans]|uniref:YbaL family putative K(+) efflux transporter n=1 Tax=Pseudomonas oryzihabitans TaxID=47885 RepID=UPI00289543FF|nr:YbaL family putative K(+) efflux transporter [Pseudomonas oryzihabitans]MDT3719660.1 YbaL family putative K(+) efflux transporter [Pseudomonas oryzihabitans]